MLSFQGAYQTPGIQAALDTTAKRVWWGIRQQQVVLGHMIDGSARDAGNTPTDVLRAGLVLGKKTSDGKLYEWDPTAADGTEDVYGILLVDMRMQYLGTDSDRWVGPIMVGGNLKANAVLIPGNSSYGINGDDYELLVRASLTQTGRFRLDDELQGSDWDGWRGMVTKVADYTILESDNNILFNNIGDLNTLVLTLPAPRPGYRFGFFIGAAQSVSIEGAAGTPLLVDGDATAASFVLQGIGSYAEVIGISTTQFLVIRHQGGIIKGPPAQVIAMNDATVQLTVTGTPAGTVLISNTLRVDAESGATEDLELPPEADCNGMTLFIYNTGGESIVVKDDAAGYTVDTIATTEWGIFFCDGTAWHGMNVA